MEIRRRFAAGEVGSEAENDALVQRLVTLHEAAGHIKPRTHSRLDVATLPESERTALAQSEAALAEDIEEMNDEEAAAEAAYDSRRQQAVLDANQERALMRDLEKLVASFSRNATPGARRQVVDYLPTMIRERLRQECDDTERRRLLLQFSANLIAPARAPEGIDDARNLLARTTSQEAMEAAIKAANEQQRPAPTPQTAPGPRPAGPGMKP